MFKFLSNDRKVILASAITGVLLISSLALFTYHSNTILMCIGCLGIILVYWNIPTWFSRNRQTTIIRDKCFNADNEGIPLRSIKNENICVILFLSINIFLTFFGYGKLWKYLNKTFPLYDNLFANVFLIFLFIGPYIIRHTYCFILNRPMDTSTQIHWVNRFPSYRHYDRSTSTDPTYAYLPNNVYYNRTHK